MPIHFVVNAFGHSLLEGQAVVCCFWQLLGKQYVCIYFYNMCYLKALWPSLPPPSCYLWAHLCGNGYYYTISDLLTDPLPLHQNIPRSLPVIVHVSSRSPNQLQEDIWPESPHSIRHIAISSYKGKKCLWQSANVVAVIIHFLRRPSTKSWFSCHPSVDGELF